MKKQLSLLALAQVFAMGTVRADAPSAPEAWLKDEAGRADFARKHAPLVINEARMAYKMAQRGADRVLALWYQMSETETHIFLNFQVIKPWSEATAPGRGEQPFQGRAFGFGSEHIGDTEDVQSVYFKNAASHDAQLVSFVTNSHGERVHYPTHHADSSEAKSYWDEASASDFATIFERLKPPAWGGLSATIRPAVKAESSYPLLKDHVVLFSSPMSHALHRGLSAASIQKNAAMFAPPARSAGKFYEYYWTQEIKPELTFAVPEDFDRTELSSLGVARASIVPYRLVPVRDVVQEMTFSKETLANMSPKLYPCRAQKFVLRGEWAVFPALPHFVDNRWLVENYAPTWLNFLENERASYWGKTESDFAWNAGSWPNGENAEDICGSLDPALRFKKLYPKTFAQQAGSLNYLSHDLADVDAAAYRPGSAASAALQAMGQGALLNSAARAAGAKVFDEEAALMKSDGR